MEVLPEDTLFVAFTCLLSELGNICEKYEVQTADQFYSSIKKINFLVKRVSTKLGKMLEGICQNKSWST